MNWFDKTIEVTAHNDPARRAVEFYIRGFSFDNQGKKQDKGLAVLDKFVEVEDGGWPDPTFRLDAATAQLLMDSLWDCGLRPTQGKGSAGQLTAVQSHLEDMRAMTFDMLGVTKPKS